MGFFGLNLSKLHRELKYKSFKYSESKQLFINDRLKNLDKVKKYNKNIISKNMSLLINNVCNVFSIKRSLFNFIELYRNKNFRWDDENYPVFKF